MKKNEILKKIITVDSDSSVTLTSGSEFLGLDKYNPFIHGNPVLPPIQATVITTTWRDGTVGCDTFDDSSRKKGGGWPATDLVGAKAGKCI